MGLAGKGLVAMGEVEGEFDCPATAAAAAAAAVDRFKQ